MRKRPLYLLALLLAIAAILTGIAAKRCAALAATAAARATAAEHDEDRISARNEAKFYVREHDRVSRGALGALFVGFALWLWSLHRGESGRQSVPLVLLLSAVIIQLLLV